MKNAKREGNDEVTSESYPPDTGQMMATSSPPTNIVSSGDSTISASTLHRLVCSIFSRLLPGCFEISILDKDERWKRSEALAGAGSKIRSEVSPVAVEAAAKYRTVTSGLTDMTVLE